MSDNTSNRREWIKREIDYNPIPRIPDGGVFLHAKDLAPFYGQHLSIRALQKRLTALKGQLGKGRGDRLTIFDFSKIEDIPLEIIISTLNAK